MLETAINLRAALPLSMNGRHLGGVGGSALRIARGGPAFRGWQEKST
jgi:hypothetical protein